MAWWILIAAGLFEVAWASGLKMSHGLTRPGPALFTLVTLAISMVLLAVSLRTIPIGTGYAVWTGIGAVGTACAGMLLFGEPFTWLRCGFIGLIITGIMGLKFVSS